MNFHLFIRRVHLYLGMFLLPWFFVYGISSVPFSHGAWFQKRYGPAQWKVRFDRPYDLAVPPDADAREMGARIVRDAGLQRAFGANRANERQFNVYLFDFRSATRITYFIDQKRLLAEDRGFRWDHFLTGVHARGGFEQPSFLHKAWGVTVDVVCIGILLWIATGIYMWWQIRGHRAWGWLALGGGVFCFVVFLLQL